MSVDPDSAAAARHLDRWAPRGPWSLTAVAVDKKIIINRTFLESERAARDAFIAEHSGKRNLYYQVNPVREKPRNAETGRETKAAKKDIARVVWFHVDVDPRAGEDLEREQRRIRRLTDEELPSGVPHPSVVIFSGGGYQLFWRLAEPIEIGGDIARAAEAERYTRQLEYLFGADHCHNIDRLMRLPGSVNLPDARKRQRGRRPALAIVVHDGYDVAHSLAAFSPAPEVQVRGETGFAPQAREDLPAERIQSVDVLNEWNVPDRIKVIIVQGRHPDEGPKDKDDSRSAWLHDVLCNLARCGVPDDVMLGIITDPEWGISESVLDKRGSSVRYAARQIARAKERAEDPRLADFNERFAVISNYGSTCRVIEEAMDYGLKRTRIAWQSFADFRNRWLHVPVEFKDAKGSVRSTPAGEWWLRHPQRRQYEAITFAPGVVTGADVFNLWRGFAYPARASDEALLYLDHVRENVCSGDQALYTYVLGWLARCVQQPACPGEVAIVLRGGRGVGKSFFAKHFGALFGRHFLQVSNPSHLVGNFNAHIQDVVVLFADEAFFAGDRKHASVLKTMITEETMPIEGKHRDVENSPNYVHLIMSSNDRHVVPAGPDERRFLVLDVGDRNKQDVAYFRQAAKQLASGGYEALLHILLTHDLSSFEVRNVPQTVALHEQKLFSLSPEESWWYAKLQEGRVLQDHSEWKGLIMKDSLQDDYVEAQRRWNGGLRHGSAVALGRFLHHMIPDLRTRQVTATIPRIGSDGFAFTERRRAHHYVIPSLEVCRVRWEEVHGREQWPAPLKEDRESQREEPF